MKVKKIKSLREVKKILAKGGKIYCEAMDIFRDKRITGSYTWSGVLKELQNSTAFKKNIDEIEIYDKNDNLTDLRIISVKYSTIDYNVLIEVGSADQMLKRNRHNYYTVGDLYKMLNQFVSATKSENKPAVIENSENSTVHDIIDIDHTSNGNVRMNIQ